MWEGKLLSVATLCTGLVILLNPVFFGNPAYYTTKRAQEQKIYAYCMRCTFPPRETEVLERLLTTDDDLQGIADSLYISRRMVQRYVSSIYEKTETKTRLGLFQSYMNYTAD